MIEKIVLEAEVPASLAGGRLDQIASELFADYSRSRLQTWIKSGDLQVNGEIRKTRDKLYGGELLSLKAEPEEQGDWLPEPMDLDIVFEDEHIIVLNKPADLVVHPAAGNYSGTLLNGLLHYCPDLIAVPRAGIVHRLDKDTTGLMVVAKTLAAHTDLVAQLADRTVSREYEAVLIGVMTGGGKVDAPLGRHPKQRKKMAVIDIGGKEAITHYRLIKRFSRHTHVRLKLETGRTHQIRVHMAHIQYPLVGDFTYAGRFRIPKGVNDELLDCLRGFKRQALHAAKLGLVHPHSGDYMEWTCDLPEDMQVLLKTLDGNEGQGMQ